jgi:phosphatidate cytidylyltransferase
MTRVISGVVLAAVFLVLIWFASATVLLFAALGVGTLAFLEYHELMTRIGADIPKGPGLVATLAALAIVPFPYVAGEAVVVAGLILIAITTMARLKTEAQSFTSAARSVAAGALAMIYVGLPLGALVGVHIFGGRGAVLILIATIAISDTAQYYSGRLAGRHLLAPRVSPKKTIEGAVGGFVAAPVFLYVLGSQAIPVARPSIIAAVGIALVAAGIAGDLFESMLKRAANMKDSSTLIPGHGGVLDRIDALLFATPIFYVYLRWQYTT